MSQSRYANWRRKRTVGTAVTRAKRQVIEYYGGICACCGETEWHFLELDHVRDDGRVHRDELAGQNIYIWLVQNSFPTPARFQVLCSNCNQGKQRNGGVCPHKRVSLTLVRKEA
jgi:hypothetical protein